MAIELEEYFLYGEPTEKQRNFLAGIHDLGLRFISGKARGNKVLQYASNEKLKNSISEPLPKQGTDFDELLEYIEKEIVGYSISQSDPRYLSFPDTGNSVATVAADILNGFLNQNLIAVDRSAPSATFVEIQLLFWLRELIGFSTYTLNDMPYLQEVGGMWTSGGNMSNHIAVLVAMHQYFPNVYQDGLASLPYKPAIVLAKGIEHFSFAGAATALGLGSDSIMWVSAKSDFTTDSKSVASAIENCPPDKKPFMVVCVAGNCRTTNIDNILELREVCDKHNIWLHVDACHGGSLLFSDKYRDLLSGISLADSVSLDPHKGLFVTYPTSYVLFKKPETLSKFCRYQEKATDPDCFDLGLITPFYGSRGFQSLNLWMLIKHLGIDGIGAAVDGRQNLNRRITKMLEDTGLFVMFNENSFYRVAFVFCPDEVMAKITSKNCSDKEQKALQKLISRYTDEYCSSLYESGDVVFDLFSLQDLGNSLGFGDQSKYSVMAMAIGHPFMAKDIEDDIRKCVLEVGQEFKARMLNEIDNLSTLETPEQLPKFAVTSGPAGW